jgi:hypothetical protein
MIIILYYYEIKELEEFATSPSPKALSPSAAVSFGSTAEAPKKKVKKVDYEVHVCLYLIFLFILDLWIGLHIY